MIGYFWIYLVNFAIVITASLNFPRELISLCFALKLLFEDLLLWQYLQCQTIAIVFEFYPLFFIRLSVIFRKVNEKGDPEIHNKAFSTRSVQETRPKEFETFDSIGIYQSVQRDRWELPAVALRLKETSTSFPGVPSLPPLSSRKRPWFWVITRLPESGRLTKCVLGEGWQCDIAKKGSSTQLSLWPDDHRQNVWRQYFMYCTCGIDVKGNGTPQKI